MSRIEITLEEITPHGLARASVEAYLHDRATLPVPDLLPEFLMVKAATFVCIKTLDGDLRGCIGSLYPLHENAAAEIIQNAIKAATEDYRFEPVRVSELAGLNFSVDILSPIEPLEDLCGHDPKEHGLIIETTEGRRGVLLPDLEGIDTAEEQLAALRRKIGLPSGTPIKMSRFRVIRYGKK